MSNDFSEHVAGIIAEYNPFHNGHAFHIQEAKKRCHAPYCIVVMSGDFVQRGAPAVFDKYARTCMALASGADLVVEMPPCFALSSAEDFASCGIALFQHLGVVTHMCFGSECGDITPLMELADILNREPEEFSQSLKNHVAAGFSYPKARQAALSRYLSSCKETKNQASLLSSPNNTLGVEYCRALLRQNSSITPVTILRKGSAYHDQHLSQDFSSATAIRKAIFEEQKSGKYLCSQSGSRLDPYIPAACQNYIRDAVPVEINDFSLLLSYRLLELAGQEKGFETFGDVSEDLALRIKKQIFQFSPFEDRIAALKTRQYTYTRVSRCLMHILLGMTKEDINARKQTGYASYIRILGFRRESARLLSAVKKAAGLPLITKTAHGPRILSPDILKQFHQDLFCSHVYQSVLEQKSHIRPKNEYTRSIVTV